MALDARKLHKLSVVFIVHARFQDKFHSASFAVFIMSTLSNHLWLWGQEPGSHHTRPFYNLPGVNKMTPSEGGSFLGIPNCCRVVMENSDHCPYANEDEIFRSFDKVVLSAIGAGGVARYSEDRSDLDEALKLAERYSNVTGAVLDDFFNSVEGFEMNGKLARHSIESIRSMKDRLNRFPQRRLDLWLVWYTYQLDFDIQPYVDLCDVITLWTWKGSDLRNIDANIQKLVSRTPNQRRLAGCYLWNYGEGKPLTAEEMAWQLDRYLYWIKEGAIEGIVICSNCVCDIGLESVDQLKEWIEKHKDLPIPPRREAFSLA